ncbi:hypothetical protein NL676_012089 [Syzygium grande]|nr:hypothetical protein NL676_012089 [Syzygium grande]
MRSLSSSTFKTVCIRLKTGCWVIMRKYTKSYTFPQDSCMHMGSRKELHFDFLMSVTIVMKDSTMPSYQEEEEVWRENKWAFKTNIFWPSYF